MNRRGKKLVSKLGVNMSFSELVQRIDQRDTNGAEEKGEKRNRKKETSKLLRRGKKFNNPR